VSANRPRSAGRGSPDRARLAAEALAEAKTDARARGDLPADSPQQAVARNKIPDGERSIDIMSGQASSLRGRPRRDEPQPLTSAIEGLLDTRGWQQRAAMGSVFGRWAEIVGRDLAAHTRPDSFADGELAVIADSTAWATQVRLLAAELVRRLNAELGDGSVLRVRVRGPAPPRRRGGWRVPGSKGPGDTYG
jgi:predicted nucleic acid-binding Zn ribbon protein